MEEGADPMAKGRPSRRSALRLRVPGLALVLGLAACSARAPGAAPRLEAEPPPGAVPWTRLAPLGGAGGFHFAILGDRTGAAREGVFEAALRKLNWLRPDFVLSVGDLIEGYTEDPGELAAQWDELEGLVAGLEMPFFYVPGNHDLGNQRMAETWRERFGPSYYHFRYQDVLFLVLNSELFGMALDPARAVPGPDTQAEQMAWVERVLAEHRAARWTLVFLHQPLWDLSKVPRDWRRVEELLGERPYTVFAGHIHSYTQERRNDRSFVTLATTGGGSGLRGRAHGEFDHVALVSMTGDGPRVANLMLEGIEGEEVRTREMRGVVNRLEAAVRGEPLAAGAGPFERGVARFRVQNRGDEPLELEARFEGGPDLALSPDGLSRRLAPGSEDLVEVEVRAASRAPLEGLRPAAARFALATRAPGGARVLVETRSQIVPERPFSCPRPARPPLLDGRLDEWGALPFRADVPAQVEAGAGWTGPADASFRFAVACDDDFVHVAVDVTDDDLQLAPRPTARARDGVSLVLDARPDPERSRNGSLWAAIRDGGRRELLFAAAAPAPPQPEGVLRAGLPARPAEVRSASRPREGGYAVELAIPAAWLDARQGGPWSAFRLELSVDDYDAGEPGPATCWWRPSRFGPSGVPGSGTFVRPVPAAR